MKGQQRFAAATETGCRGLNESDADTDGTPFNLFDFVKKSANPYRQIGAWASRILPNRCCRYALRLEFGHFSV